MPADACDAAQDVGGSDGQIGTGIGITAGNDNVLRAEFEDTVDAKLGAGATEHNVTDSNAARVPLTDGHDVAGP
jgi:hypothetical protein